MYAVPNLGTVFYVILIFSLLVVIERGWSRCKNNRSKPHHARLNRFLYWNAMNTFAMEIYLEMGFAVSLNLYAMIWLDNNPDLSFTNMISYFGLIFLITWPIWMVIFYAC